MAIPNMSEEQIRTTLTELEQATYNHSQWAEILFGTLIRHQTPDERDITGETHRMCRFGQWYYKCGIPALQQHPGFAEIGIEHEHMHRFAASLLRSSMGGEPSSINDYENFVATRKRLQLEIATIQHELEDALHNLDPLTRTSNRVAMLTKLREQQEFVKRKVHSCIVAMMDLDHFKTVNDKYGHVVGDKVLIGFAQYITAHLRPYDKVFRYGGEEFLICLPDTDLLAGHNIIDRLRESLGSLPFEASGAGKFHVTVSFGLTLLDPDMSVEQSIDRADKALYAAKAMGRNRTIDWDASMNVSQALV